MKRNIYLIIIFLILFIAAMVSVKTVIIRIAQKQLGRVFIDGEIFVGGSQLVPLRRASLLNIAIKREGVYSFKIGQIAAEYSVTSILQGKILKVTVKDAQVEINLPRKNILDFTQYLKLGPPGAFTVEELALSDCRLNIHSKDVNADVRVSAELALEDLFMRSVSLEVASLDGYGLLLEDGVLKANLRSGPNEFHIRSMQYDKIKIGDFNGALRLEDGIFFLDTFFARAFNGLIEGYATLKAGSDAEYLADLKFVDLNLEEFINAFELDKKFRMDGLIGGELTINGRGADLEVLDGDFAITKAGGTLVITDPQILENIASYSSQSMDILVESFRNYHYNNGTVTLSLEKNDLLVDMALDGETGKRNLNIVVHDYQLKKDGL